MLHLIGHTAPSALSNPTTYGRPQVQKTASGCGFGRLAAGSTTAVGAVPPLPPPPPPPRPFPRHSLRFSRPQRPPCGARWAPPPPPRRRHLLWSHPLRNAHSHPALSPLLSSAMHPALSMLTGSAHTRDYLSASGGSQERSFSSTDAHHRARGGVPATQPVRRAAVRTMALTSWLAGSSSRHPVKEKAVAARGSGCSGGGGGRRRQVVARPVTGVAGGTHDHNLQRHSHVEAKERRGAGSTRPLRRPQPRSQPRWCSGRPETGRAGMAVVGAFPFPVALPFSPSPPRPRSSGFRQCIARQPGCKDTPLISPRLESWR